MPVPVEPEPIPERPPIRGPQPTQGNPEKHPHYKKGRQKVSPEEGNHG